MRTIADSKKNRTDIFNMRRITDKTRTSKTKFLYKSYFIPPKSTCVLKDKNQVFF